MVTARESYKTGRLTARPGKETGAEEVEPGEHPLGLDAGKDGFLYVPQQYDRNRPAALALMLHGAGAPAAQGLSLLRPYADEHNMILVAPASRSYSWDIIASRAFGVDVLFIDQALAQVFEHYAVDPKHIAIGGFSDGASYALSLGLTNGDLFTHLIAFSPGFAHTHENHGHPAVFISHGLHDRVLPIAPCSRRLVPRLQSQGVTPVYVEFDGEHEIPAHISEQAVNWFTGKTGDATGDQA